MKKNHVIRVLTGSLKGRIFSLKKTLLIGRKSGDIVLKEPSVSEPHAEIKKHSNSRIMLEDLDSKNGILVDGKIKVKILLEPNMIFTIGDTDLQLIIFKSPEELHLEFLNRNLKRLKDKPKHLKAFVSPVKIHCIDGPQKGEIFLLSYGPRFFGSGCVDVPLLDSNIPEKAFQLIPRGRDILFHTEYPELFSKKDTTKQPLRDGDIITCGDTKLRVSFK